VRKLGMTRNLEVIEVSPNRPDIYLEFHSRPDRIGSIVRPILRELRRAFEGGDVTLFPKTIIW
jgi:hypothetical protein